MFERQYRNHLSGYKQWDQLSHAEDWILFPQNMGSYIGVDEVALFQGELYTIVINKEAHGKKGSIIVIIKGIDVQTVSSVLLKMPRRRRFQTREITLDMASNMELIAKTCFPAAKRVIDRFHVQNQLMMQFRKCALKPVGKPWTGKLLKYIWPKQKVRNTRHLSLKMETLSKQLLARSRYLLFKKESLWTISQKQRANVLFRECPNIKKAYYLTLHLGLIYQQTKHADVDLTKFAHWYDKVDQSGFLSFGTIVRTIQSHYMNIVNFFDNRSTNAASESFNAKIKAFRRQFRGVKDKAFSGQIV